MGQKFERRERKRYVARIVRVFVDQRKAVDDLCSQGARWSVVGQIVPQQRKSACPLSFHYRLSQLFGYIVRPAYSLPVCLTVERKAGFLNLAG